MAMITLEQIAEKVIERIKAFPSTALFSQADVGPKTTWDEYMENYQYEGYEFFDYELYQDTINGMIEDEIEELSSEDIDILYHSIYGKNKTTDRGEMHQEIEKSIFTCIHDRALSEEIEYNSPLVKYVKFHEDDNSEDGQLIVAEVVKKINPSEYLLQIYSSEIPSEGKQETYDWSSLRRDFGLEEITFEEFEEIKNSFYLMPVDSSSEYLQKQGIETKGNPQDDKEIMVSILDALRPKNISDIIFRLDEYIDSMREHRQEARVFMDFLEQYIKNYFNRPILDELELKKTAVEIVDEMYIRITNILTRDIHTNAYFGIIVNRLFNELEKRNIFLFYVLDNQIRDDRFKLTVESFGVSHFTTIYPYVVEKLEHGNGYTQLPSKDFREIRKEIDDAIDQKKHICYIEKDSSVNYLKNVLAIAEEHQNEYLCIFRNQAPDSHKKATWLMGSFSDLISY